MGKGLPRSIARSDLADLMKVQRKTILISAALSFTGVTDTAVFATTELSEGLPEGNILLLGAVANVTLTGPTSDDLADDFQGDLSVGTAATADTTLNGLEVNVIASTAIAAATAEVEVTRATNATTAFIDNTAAATGLHLNVVLDANEVTNAEVVEIAATGEVEIFYAVLGDD